MFENIEILLAIDPTFLGLFGAMSLGAVQIVKTVFRPLEQYAIVLNAIFSLSLAGLLIPEGGDWRESLISAFVLAYLIASSASGTYSWVASSKKDVSLPVYDK